MQKKYSVTLQMFADVIRKTYMKPAKPIYKHVLLILSFQNTNS